MMCYVLLPEIELDFAVPLKDVTVPEKRQARFECVLTREANVIWSKGTVYSRSETNLTSLQMERSTYLSSMIHSLMMRENTLLKLMARRAQQDCLWKASIFS